MSDRRHPAAYDARRDGNVYFWINAQTAALRKQAKADRAKRELMEISRRVAQHEAIRNLIADDTTQSPAPGKRKSGGNKGREDYEAQRRRPDTKARAVLSGVR